MAPNGNNKTSFWSSLVAGRSGIGPITLFDASKHPSRIAGEVKNFDLSALLGRPVKVKRMARQTQLALAAMHEALTDAQLLNGAARAPGEKLPLYLGVSSSAIEVIEQGMERMAARGPSHVPTHTVQGCQPHQAASTISEFFPIINLTATISSACAAGLDAIGAAYAQLREGRFEIALAGGADAPINPLTFACLAKAGLLSMCNSDPAHASRPFDRRRDSGVISEGAGVVVLETLEHARARGCPCYLELKSYATRMDPDMSSPGSGFAVTMEMALAHAGKRPVDIGMVCAHGAGHPVLDVVETAAIKQVLGDHAYHIPVVSIKAVTGNPLAAAGALQVIACALSMQAEMVPPTANLEVPDPACDLDYVPGTARHARVDCILINAHGLGGGNSSLVVERLA
jgi:3-oxoacyl-[acyl-carrier-protein] synthase II